MYATVKGKVQKLNKKSEDKVSVRISQHGGHIALAIFKDSQVKLTDKIEQGDEVQFYGGIFAFYDSNQGKTVTLIYPDEVIKVE